HTLDGRLAATTRTLEARKPLAVQPLAPDELTASDRADVRVNVVNRTDKEQDVDVEFFRSAGKRASSVAPKHPAAEDMAKKSRLRLEAGKEGDVIYPFTPDKHQRQATLQVEGRAPNLPVDAVQRSI